eukprot:355319-Chlamydomonas_euryale.AAC.1
MSRVAWVVKCGGIGVEGGFALYDCHVLARSLDQLERGSDSRVSTCCPPTPCAPLPKPHPRPHLTCCFMIASHACGSSTVAASACVSPSGRTNGHGRTEFTDLSNHDQPFPPHPHSPGSHQAVV